MKKIALYVLQNPDNGQMYSLKRKVCTIFFHCLKPLQVSAENVHEEESRNLGHLRLGKLLVVDKH